MNWSKTTSDELAVGITGKKPAKQGERFHKECLYGPNPRTNGAGSGACREIPSAPTPALVAAGEPSPGGRSCSKSRLGPAK